MNIEVDKYTVEDKKGRDKEKKVLHELRFLDTCKFIPSSQSSLVANITAFGKCESCCPGDCHKEYEEGGIESCGKCKNCLLIQEPCFEPTTKYLRETHEIFGEKTNLLTRCCECPTCSMAQPTRNLFVHPFPLCTLVLTVDGLAFTSV